MAVVRVELFACRRFWPRVTRWRRRLAYRPELCISKGRVRGPGRNRRWGPRARGVRCVRTEIRKRLRRAFAPELGSNLRGSGLPHLMLPMCNALDIMEFLGWLCLQK